MKLHVENSAFLYNCLSFLGLFNDAFNSSDYVASNDKIG
jgi:hypothetical protein